MHVGRISQANSTMERLQEIINQLQEQMERKAEPAQMLVTARMLEAELNYLAEQASRNRVSTTKIAVVMPSSMKIYTGHAAAQEARSMSSENNPMSARSESPVADRKTPVTDKQPEPAVDYRPEPVADYKPVPVNDNRPAPVNENKPTPVSENKPAPISENKPLPVNDNKPAAVNDNKPAAVNAALRQQATAGVGSQAERGPWPYDPLAEIPTLTHQQQPKEINDIMGRSVSTSLNEKLRSDVLELKSALNDTPVRDLKKAIGINDRFVFISQLFRGDEVMYERSLKTINSFRILPEAEYWMERELKVKLGWDENREPTKHFYHLVRRRFS